MIFKAVSTCYLPQSLSALMQAVFPAWLLTASHRLSLHDDCALQTCMLSYSLASSFPTSRSQWQQLPVVCQGSLSPANDECPKPGPLHWLFLLHRTLTVPLNIVKVVLSWRLCSNVPPGIINSFPLVKVAHHPRRHLPHACPCSMISLDHSTLPCMPSRAFLLC